MSHVVGTTTMTPLKMSSIVGEKMFEVIYIHPWPTSLEMFYLSLISLHQSQTYF